jgi:WD40 repeat protein
MEIKLRLDMKMVMLKFIQQCLFILIDFFDKINIYFRLKPQNEKRVEPIQKISDRTDRIQSIAFSPNNKYLAIGCVDGSFDIYDVQNKYTNLRFRNTSKSINYLFNLTRFYF